MNKIERVKEIALKEIKETEYNLYDVEYVKEGEEYFLRIYFDKNEGLTIDDCVLLSEKMSLRLDEEDFIKEKYYLEVSSPGIERELKTIDDIYSSVGKYVYIKTYEKINNNKEFFGYILFVEDDVVTLEYKEKATVKITTIDYKKIAKIRLAVKF